MAMIEVKVSPEPGSMESARRHMAELALRSKNVSGGLKLIGDKLLRNQNARFRAMEGPDGAKWPKLRPLTLLTGGKNSSIMRRSGTLMGSGNFRVQGATVSVGISGVQAGVQQFGKTIVPKKAQLLAIPKVAGRASKGFLFAKKVTIPPRPMVGFGPKDEKAVRTGVREWLAIDGKG